MCILWYYRRSYALMSPVLSFDFDECYSQGKSLALWEVNMKVASVGISVGSVLTLFFVWELKTLFWSTCFPLNLPYEILFGMFKLSITTLHY